MQTEYTNINVNFRKPITGWGSFLGSFKKMPMYDRLQQIIPLQNNVIRTGRAGTQAHFDNQFFPYSSTSKPILENAFGTSIAGKPVELYYIWSKDQSNHLYSKFLNAKNPSYNAQQDKLAEARRWARNQRALKKPVSVSQFNKAYSNYKVQSVPADIVHQRTRRMKVYPMTIYDSKNHNGVPIGVYHPRSSTAAPIKSAYGQQIFWHPRSLPANLFSMTTDLQRNGFWDKISQFRYKMPYMFSDAGEFTARLQGMQDFYKAQTGKRALNPEQAMTYINNYVKNKGWLRQKGTLEQRLNNKSVARHLQNMAVTPLLQKMYPEGYNGGSMITQNAKTPGMKQRQFVYDNWNWF